MNLTIKYTSLLNFLIFFGFISVPASMLLSRSVFLSIFFFGILILFFFNLKKIRFNHLIILIISFLYLLLTAAIRPENLLVSLRLFFVIITGYIAFSYSKKCDTNDILKLVRITFFIGLLSSIVGLIQFIFGYSDLDIALLVFQGSRGVAEDFEKFNRVRSLGITYGALSQGILLGFTLHSVIFLNKIEKRIYLKTFYLFAFVLILVSLLATLNRTTIIGTLLSFIIYFNFRSVIFFFLKISWIFKLILFFIFISILISILNLSVFENINIGLTSIFRAFGIYDNSEMVGDYFTRGKTLDIRVGIITRSIELLISNPFGLKEAPFFSIDDAGIFSPLLKYGFFGGGIIILIIFLPLPCLIKFYLSKKKRDINNDLLRMLYAFYIITICTNTISFSLDGTITMLLFWLVIFLVIRISFFEKKFKITAYHD